MSFQPNGDRTDHPKKLPSRVGCAHEKCRPEGERCEKRSGQKMPDTKDVH